jgi:putative membrane protein
MSGRDRYNLALLCLFLTFWLVLAVAPVDRQTWLLENVLVLLSVPLLVLGHRRLPLSRISYTLLTLFFCMHAIGAHYTYSLVPYDDAWRAIFGSSLNEALGFSRNHYDRLVHFLFGALLAYPCRELFIRVAGVKGFWGYLLPVLLMMSFSLASLGAIVSMGVTLLVNACLQRDFALEWQESLRVKDPTPLGEVAIARMLDAPEQDQSE